MEKINGRSDNHLRRLKEKEQIREIRNYLPITKSYNKKISDIDVLHVLCVYLKAQACLKNNPLNESYKSDDYILRLFFFIIFSFYKDFQQIHKNLKNIKISPVLFFNLKNILSNLHFKFLHL
jgi:hypothetical protein